MLESHDSVLEEVRNGFGHRKIVVIGDLMLDRYLWGDVQRISPEAPVPVLHLKRRTESAGGAANVARNLSALGLDVHLVGVTGDDPERAALIQALNEFPVRTQAVLIARDRSTTTKTRVIGNHQQMIRIDDERTSNIAAGEHKALLDHVRALLPEASALVLSDYAKGVLSPALCKDLIKEARARQVPVLADPKGKSFAKYCGATLITPNVAELTQATGLTSPDISLLLSAAGNLRRDLSLDLLVLTLSELGMALIDEKGNRQIPAVAREVFDVSGAGDTVIATFAAGLAAELGAVDTSHLANLAAGVVVGKLGTAPITKSELLAAVQGESALQQAAKIADLVTAKTLVRQWQAAGERVVFTNGCFDLLHVGHVTYLERASRYGQRLIIGLNTDRSVRSLKGRGRPLIREQDRARVLAALESVDMVVLFDTPTPLNLIVELGPDVLAKGADYREEDVVGAPEVKSRGGRVVLIPLVENRSTTGIVKRMNDIETTQDPS